MNGFPFLIAIPSRFGPFDSFDSVNIFNIASFDTFDFRSIFS